MTDFPENFDFVSYYETNVRLARTLNPALTLDEYARRIFFWNRIEAAQLGESEAETKIFEQMIRHELAEAWKKSDAVKTEN